MDQFSEVILAVLGFLFNFWRRRRNRQILDLLGFFDSGIVVQISDVLMNFVRTIKFWNYVKTTEFWNFVRTTEFGTS